MSASPEAIKSGLSILTGGKVPNIITDSGWPTALIVGCIVLVASRLKADDAKRNRWLYPVGLVLSVISALSAKATGEWFLSSGPVETALWIMAMTTLGFAHSGLIVAAAEGFTGLKLRTCASAAGVVIDGAAGQAKSPSGSGGT